MMEELLFIELQKLIHFNVQEFLLNKIQMLMQPILMDRPHFIQLQNFKIFKWLYYYFKIKEEKAVDQIVQNVEI